MFARIRAISSYLPAQIEYNDGLVEGRFIKKIGVKSRHIATDESAGDLALGTNMTEAVTWFSIQQKRQRMETK